MQVSPILVNRYFPLVSVSDITKSELSHNRDRVEGDLILRDNGDNFRVVFSAGSGPEDDWVQLRSTFLVNVSPVFSAGTNARTIRGGATVARGLANVLAADLADGDSDINQFSISHKAEGWAVFDDDGAGARSIAIAMGSAADDPWSVVDISDNTRMITPSAPTGPSWSPGENDYRANRNSTNPVACENLGPVIALVDLSSATATVNLSESSDKARGSHVLVSRNGRLDLMVATGSAATDAWFDVATAAGVDDVVPV